MDVAFHGNGNLRPGKAHLDGMHSGGLCLIPFSIVRRDRVAIV
jgi:hypothetical protein